MINTVAKFIQVTGYTRGENYPTKKQVKDAIRKHKVSSEKSIDILSYYLY